MSGHCGGEKSGYCFLCGHSIPRIADQFVRSVDDLSDHVSSEAFWLS